MMCSIRGDALHEYWIMGANDHTYRQRQDPECHRARLPLCCIPGVQDPGFAILQVTAQAMPMDEN
jgi:hypothetical protein